MTVPQSLFGNGAWGILILGLCVVLLAIRVLREPECGVIFRCGKLRRTAGPGLVFLIPFVDRLVKVDLSVMTINVPTQEVKTGDQILVNVDAVVSIRVVDPGAVMTEIGDVRQASLQNAAMTLRRVVGQARLDELLSQPGKMNRQLREMIDWQTELWGIEVTTAEIRNLVATSATNEARAALA